MDYEKIRLTNLFLDKLIYHGATYASITAIKDGKIEIFNSSNRNWEEKYHESELSKDCYLMNTGKKLLHTNNNFTVIWDNVILTNENEFKLFELREQNNLCHGVSFAQLFPDGTLQAIGIAGKRIDKTFARTVIENKAKILSCFGRIKKY